MNEKIDSFRAILENALTVHSALVARRQTEAGLAQNDEIKKISSWAAIIFAPTLVGTVYGMNFDVMPELHWGVRLPDGHRCDGRLRRRSVRGVQVQEVALIARAESVVGFVTAARKRR